MEYKFEKKDYEELRDRAKEIIKNASKDIALWDAILKETEKQINSL